MMNMLHIEQILKNILMLHCYDLETPEYQI